MKLLKQLFPVFVVLAMWSSCTTDDSPIPGVIAPASSISSSAETIAANGSFNVTLTATQGDSPLNTLTIQKDGSGVTPADVTIDGSQISSAAILLFNSDKTSFSYDIAIQTNLMAGESAVYSFIIDAENNDNTTETITIDVAVPTIPPTLAFATPGNWEGIQPGALLPGDEIVGTQTDALLATFAAYEDGVLIEASRLYFGANVFASNPLTLDAGQQDGFTENLGVFAHTAEETRTYMYILTDVNGLTDTASYTVQVVAPATALSIDTTGIVFFNRNGSGLGGLDLDLPGAVMFNSADAHIRDLGIDTNLPTATNWIRQVTAENGATIILLSGADFDSIDSKEGAAAAYDAGSGSPTTLTDGTVIGVLDADGTTKYIVRFDQVNMTDSDNDDNYSVSIKY